MTLSTYLLYTALVASLGALGGWWVARDLYRQRPVSGQKVNP